VCGGVLSEAELVAVGDGWGIGCRAGLAEAWFVERPTKERRTIPQGLKPTLFNGVVWHD
jgi:hypothetical protein